MALFYVGNEKLNKGANDLCTRASNAGGDINMLVADSTVAVNNATNLANTVDQIDTTGWSNVSFAVFC